LSTDKEHAMNQRPTEVNDLKGSEVTDRDGDKVGKLEAVHLDRRTDEPAWGLVKLSGLRSGHRFVSLRGARNEDDALRIGAGRADVEAAPEVNADAELTPSEEEKLTRHYDSGARGEEPGRDRDVRERPAARERDRPARDRDRDRGTGGGLAAAADRYGGINWGASFFGWLVAVGIASLLIALIGAAGAATGLTDTKESDVTTSADTIGIVGGVLLLVVLLIAYYAGGYVAGRMSRFDGARQGVGAWLIGLIVTILLGAAGAIFGSKYNVLEQLKLPRIPIDEGSLTTGGIIALAAVILGTLLTAVLGGRVGRRYHDKVDQAALGR